MTKIWFTSDTHFGHKNIIEYCNRPFASVDEMDRELIRRWNARVAPEDIVWHLGDFTMGSVETASKYRFQLNGRICLVPGNHDQTGVVRCNTDFISRIEDDGRKSVVPALWGVVSPMIEIKEADHLIVLNHYAMRVWNKCHRGALHLFGHSHGNMSGNNQSLDVGVDCWDYQPVNLDEILARMRTLPKFKPEDHHGG